MLSGQYPARTGCNNNNTDRAYNGAGFYGRITAQGYQSCCVGKMHNLWDVYGPMGFESRHSQEEIAAEGDEYMRDIREKYPWVFDYHGMRSEMYYTPQISQLPPEDHPTQWVGDRSVDFIQPSALLPARAVAKAVPGGPAHPCLPDSGGLGDFFRSDRRPLLL